jgi:hypothetical protein
MNIVSYTVSPIRAISGFLTVLTLRMPLGLALEPIAIPYAQRIQTLVWAGQVSIGEMFIQNGKSVVFV